MLVNNTNVGMTDGGHKVIDVDRINAETTAFANDYEKIITYMKNIQEGFIDGTANDWDSPAAGEYVDAVANSLNDFGGQSDTKFDATIKAVIDVANVITSKEGAEAVKSVQLGRIQKLGKNWQPQTKKFKVPNEFGNVANEKLVKPLAEMNEVYESMAKHVEALETEGLDKACGDAAIVAINSLKKSAQDVLNGYSEAALNKVLEKDRENQRLANHSYDMEY